MTKLPKHTIVFLPRVIFREKRAYWFGKDFAGLVLEQDELELTPAQATDLTLGYARQTAECYGGVLTEGVSSEEKVLNILRQGDVIAVLKPPKGWHTEYIPHGGLKEDDVAQLGETINVFKIKWE